MATPEHGDRIDVKAGESGVELRLPYRLIERFLPGRWVRRRDIDDAIAARIIAKIGQGLPLDEGEIGFVTDTCSVTAGKYVRLAEIQERARQLRQDEGGDEPTGPDAPADSEAPSGDWLNKFREDASLVDDDVMREVYARVLAEEDRRPGSVSLRTLGILRYLDHRTAVAFAQLQNVVMNGKVVPQQSPLPDHVLRVAGLDHETMLLLDDAGLVSSSASSEVKFNELVAMIHVKACKRLILAMRPDRTVLNARLRVHLLTPAGRELARIANVEPNLQVYAALVRWLRAEMPTVELRDAVGKPGDRLEFVPTE